MAIGCSERRCNCAITSESLSISGSGQPGDPLRIESDNVSTMTNAERLALTGPELWNGREVYATDTQIKWGYYGTTWMQLAQSAWTAYTPTLGVWTLGNGTAVGRYVRISKLIVFGAKITFGSTSVFTVGQPTITTPASSGVSPATGDAVRANVAANFTDATGGQYYGRVHLSGTTATPLVMNGFLSGTPGTFYPSDANISSTVPITWAVNDAIIIYGSYEAA